jgi:multidrug efflux pump
MMCAKFLKNPRDAGKQRLAHFLDARFEWLERRYEHMLHGVLNYLPVIVVFAVGILVAIYLLFSVTPQELAPTEDQGFVLVATQAGPQSTLDQLSMYADQLNKYFKKIPAIDHFFEINGTSGTNSGFAGLSLKSWGDRDVSQEQVKNKVQKEVTNVAGLKAQTFTPPTLPGAGGNFGVQVVVSSTQPPEQMLKVVNNFLGKLRDSGKFIYTDTNLKYDKPQVTVELDRNKVADLGLNMSDVGGDLASMLGGGYINYFSLGGRSYRVIAQTRREARLNPEQLENYHIKTGGGKTVPLSTVAHLSKKVIPESLYRFQQLNSAQITAVQTPGMTIGDALKVVQDTAATTLPKGYSLGYSGQSRQYEQESGALITTFFFAIIIIYLVLAALFESFRDPFIVLISVPMSISGALIFLALGFATVNIYTEVGLITLIGLISKHGILIVRFANDLQAAGRGKREAVEEAAGIRLRPILMTTAAMVMGVVPLLISTGPGAVSRFDIGLVIAAGMSIGTLFTLFVVPSMYLLLAKTVKQEEPDGEPDDPRQLEAPE